MKVLMKRWLLGFVVLFVLAGVYAPQRAEAQVVVRVGSSHHYRRPVHHYHHYYHRSYRHR
jgi:hypothetical protein